MAIQEHQPHMLHLPKFFTIIKYFQLVIAVLVVALSAFCVAVLPFNAMVFALFVGVYSMGTIIYFLVASKATPKSYNWVALLVLEILATIFWLAAWAVMGALFAALAYIGSTYNSYDDYYYRVKRSLEARSAYSYGLGFAGCLIAAIALAVINFLIYVLTLIYMGRAIHRHRKSGQPIRAGADAAPSYANEWPAANAAPVNVPAPDYEKGNAVPMQSMGGNQEYYAQQPAPPYPQPQAGQTQMPAEPQRDAAPMMSPMSTGQHSEMGMGIHGEMHEAPSQRY